jgi:hypothetical protein
MMNESVWPEKFPDLVNEESIASVKKRISSGDVRYGKRLQNAVHG